MRYRVLAIAGMCLMPWQARTEVRFGVSAVISVPGGEWRAAGGTDWAFFPLSCSEVTGASVKDHGKGARSSKKD